MTLSFSVLGVLSSVKVLQCCFKNVLRVFKVSRMFPVSIKGVYKKFQGSFKGVSREFKGNFKGVSSKIAGRFKTFKGGFKGI